MAIIYSYPTATPNMNTLLLGTAVDAETGLNVTKQFSVSAIGSLIASEYVVVSELTTAGTTGAATLIDGVLNIPEYALTLGYRMYTVYLTQSGLSDPAKTILYDDIDGAIAFERVVGSPGTYTCTITGADTFDSAWYAITDNRFSLGVNQNYIVINKTASNVITIYTYKAGVLSDGLLLDTPMEIKIFD